MDAGAAGKPQSVTTIQRGNISGKNTTQKFSKVSPNKNFYFQNLNKMVCIAVASNVTSSVPNKFSPVRSTQKPKMKKKSRTDREFKSLREIVPSVSGKQHVDKLEVVLEAIQYIRQLEEQLCEIDPSLLKAAFMATACGIKNWSDLAIVSISTLIITEMWKCYWASFRRCQIRRNWWTHFIESIDTLFTDLIDSFYRPQDAKYSFFGWCCWCSILIKNHFEMYKFIYHEKTQKLNKNN